MVYRPPDVSSELDEVDLGIMARLQEDGRSSNASIARCRGGQRVDGEEAHRPSRGARHHARARGGRPHLLWPRRAHDGRHQRPARHGDRGRQRARQAAGGRLHRLLPRALRHLDGGVHARTRTPSSTSSRSASPASTTSSASRPSPCCARRRSSTTTGACKTAASRARPMRPRTGWTPADHDREDGPTHDAARGTQYGTRERPSSPTTAEPVHASEGSPQWQQRPSTWGPAPRQPSPAPRLASCATCPSGTPPSSVCCRPAARTRSSCSIPCRST